VSDFVNNVIAFNRDVLKIEPRPIGMMSQDECDITAKCLTEEKDEFIEAVESNDFLGSIDALVDGIYFGIGAMYKSGLTYDQVCDCVNAVHDANMEKKLGVNAKRATGAADAVKPEGWIPPERRISSILGDKWPS
jgi:predicted HAD superfamily Cof-like phosphohydrolase